MARMARLVVPNHPHHVTQPGNRRQPVFFFDDDYRAYLALMQKAREHAETAVLAYYLMPNHVYLIMVPRHADRLRGAIGEAHRRYTRRVNFRQHWRSHLLHTRTGRPLGSEGFVDRLDSITGRALRPARSQANGWIAESVAATTDCGPAFSILSPEQRNAVARYEDAATKTFDSPRETIR